MRNDDVNHQGDYRTKHVILEIHDAMQQAMTNRTILTELNLSQTVTIAIEGSTSTRNVALRV